MERKNWLLIVSLVIVFHLFLLIRLKFTSWPEMVLWPYLMIHGWLPYQDVAIAHAPLLLIKLAAFYKVFGVGVLQLKIFTWFLILIFDLAIFWVIQNLWNRRVAFFSLISFLLFQIFYDGNGLWFDIFMGLFGFVSFYFVQKRKWLWAGVFWALSFASKQTAVWFLVPIAFQIVQGSGAKLRRLLSFAYGAVPIFGIFFLWLAASGILSDFYYWAVHFGIFILPRMHGQIQLPDIKNLVVSVFPFLIFVPLLFRSKGKTFNLFVWAIAGSMGAYPRFEYFHFQPAIPYLAIVTGLLFSEIKKMRNLWKIFIAFYLLGNLYLFGNYFLRNWGEGTRFFEQDVSDLVSYLKSNAKEGDKIFVMNWWDNIYALSGTLPATDPWVPQLSWYQELPGIQEKEVSDLKEVRPKMIVLQSYSETGLSAYIPRKVYDYVIANYRVKEKIDNLEILIPK